MTGFVRLYKVDGGSPRTLAEIRRLNPDVSIDVEDVGRLRTLQRGDRHRLVGRGDADITLTYVGMTGEP